MHPRITSALLLTLASVALPAHASDTRIELGPDLYLEPLAPGVWMHVSAQEMEGWGRVAANGLIIVSGTDAALVDTPWTNEQTRLLADWVEGEHDAQLALVIPTHWHGDCLGGLAAAHELGAASYGSEKTIELARSGDAVVPENGFDERLDLSVGSLLLSLEALGPGHTLDNIVVWLPQRKILFGGCLVKSAKSKTMGYTAEADLETWPQTIDRVAQRVGGDALIVPGHGLPGGDELFARTKELIDEFTRAKAEQ